MVVLYRVREDVWNNSKFSQIPQDICSEDYISSLQKLEPRIEEFIRDHNGNHVIQKCIEAMEPEDKQIILNRYDNKVSTYIQPSLHTFKLRQKEMKQDQNDQ